MRRSVFYQPLAVLMALLVAPPFSWLGNSGSRGGDTGSAGPLEAAAQIVVPGTFSLPPCKEDTSILKPGCETNPNGLSDIVKDRAAYSYLTQFESDAVQGYLSLHNRPASDAGLIYSTGRSDLR